MAENTKSLQNGGDNIHNDSGIHKDANHNINKDANHKDANHNNNKNMNVHKNTSATPVNFTNIPAELKASAGFCVWKRTRMKGASQANTASSNTASPGATSSRMTKIPYNPVTGEMARTNDASTFGSFVSAMKTYAMGGYDGIGIRVSDDIGAIDIDHCIREDGTLSDVAASILGIFKDAYFERSPSGTGLRGFFRLEDGFAYDKTVYYINNRSLGLEIYLPGTTNRFVTVTGDQFRAGIVPKDNLDRYEGYPNFYYKKMMRVTYKGVRTGKARTVIAFVYIMHEDRSLGIPSELYMETCRVGYRYFGFDEGFLEKAPEDSRNACGRWEDMKWDIWGKRR